jgi:hypothetical protein
MVSMIHAFTVPACAVRAENHSAPCLYKSPLVFLTALATKRETLGSLTKCNEEHTAVSHGNSSKHQTQII